MKKILLLGSTGSIGENALKVIESFPLKFKLAGIIAGKNLKKIEEQILKYKIKNAGINDKEVANVLKKKFPDLRIFSGEDEILKMIDEIDFDLALSAIVGSAGLLPSYKIIEKGKNIALANKESLVMGGDFFIKKAKEKRVKIIPVDSEHCAIHQALRAGKKNEVKRIILTASGGPFWKKNLKELKNVKVKDALKHPTWKMGKKITIDSATMANKGLEVIEAHYLFGLPHEKIDVIIHPQSIIHSIVEFRDGFLIAQISPNDMKFPIQYALSFPERLPSPFKPLNLSKLNLNFFKVDFKKFPMLGLAYYCLKEKKGYPMVYSIANEICVYGFLEEKIKFLDIPKIVEASLERFGNINPGSVMEIKEIEKEIKEKIKGIIIRGDKMWK